MAMPAAQRAPRRQKFERGVLQETTGEFEAQRESLVTERISPVLTWTMPCSDSMKKFPESSFRVIRPSIGFGNRPVSGRRVTLTRSPIANIFKELANDSNIAMSPPIIASDFFAPISPLYFQLNSF
jgi:hypothetical protein